MKISWLHQPARRVIGYTEDEKEIFQLTETWACHWEYKGQQRYLTAPNLYIWDGASMPRISWTILGLTPSGIMDAPSVAHDVPYRSKGGRNRDALRGATITNEHGNRVIVSRQEADRVLYAAMLYAGVDNRKATAVYPIVRIGGLAHWGGPIPALAKGVDCYA